MENIFSKMGYIISSTRSNTKDTVLDVLIIKNPDGSPRWIWDATSRKPLFLKFYNIGSFRAWFFATSIKTIFILRLQKFAFTKKRYYVTKTRNTTVNHRKNWALFTGTIGPNNKAVLYANNSFYKIATTLNAQKLITWEHHVLEKLNQTPKVFVTPKSKQITKDIIQLTDISENGTRFKRITTAHLNTLAAMNKIENNTVKLSEWTLLNRLKINFNNIQDSRIPTNMIRKIDAIIQNSAEDEKIELSLSQGDFTQWNMFERNEKIALYDWELARFDRSKGFDYFHFIIQQGALVDRKSWKEIYAKIVAYNENKVENQIFQDDLNKYLKWYLIVNCMHYLKVYSKQQNWHVQIDWLLQVWNEGLNMFMIEEKSSRELIIMDLFDFMKNKEYAALKHGTGFPESLSINSDIDLIIDQKTNKQIVSFMKQHSLVSKITVNEKSFMNTIQIMISDGTMLSVDLIWQLKIKQLEFLDARRIIANKYLNVYGVKNASSIDTARYIVLFYVLNNAEIPTKYLGYKLAIQNSNQSLDLIIKDYFENTKKDKLTLLHFIEKDPKNKSLLMLKNTFNYLLDTLKTCFNNSGFVITFSGVDGAGKSTVIEKIAFRIEKQLRKPVVVLRHRPSVLPILSVWSKGKKQAHLDVIAGLPRQGKNKSILSSLARFSYYYLDYLFGQFVVYFKYTFRGKVVIYDRYYFDFINDSKRSNIVLPKKITSFLYRFLLSPKFNFFLFADADIILKRKEELTKATIEKLTTDYHDLFQLLQSKSTNTVYESINNLELELTLNQVLKTIVLAK